MEVKHDKKISIDCNAKEFRWIALAIEYYASTMEEYGESKEDIKEVEQISSLLSLYMV